MQHFHRRRQKVRGPEHVVPLNGLMRQQPRREVGEIAADHQQHGGEQRCTGRRQHSNQAIHRQAAKRQECGPCVAEIDSQEVHVKETVDHRQHHLRVIRGVQSMARVKGRARGNGVRGIGRPRGVMAQIERVVVTVELNAFWILDKPVRERDRARAGRQSQNQAARSKIEPCDLRPCGVP